MMKKSTFIALAVLAACLLSFGVAFAKSEKIKVGVSPVISSSGFFLAQERGYFKELGLDVEIMQFGKSGAAILPVLASGDLQVGGGSLSPGVFNAVKSGVGVKIVADKASIDPNDAHDAIILRKDLFDSGKVKSAKDFKGLKVGLASAGKTNILAIGLERFLKRGGLTLDDVTIVSVSFPEMVAAIDSKNIDAACPVEPFIAKAVDMGSAVRFHGFEETIPNYQVAVVYYGEGFIKDRPEDAKKFMLAYVKGLRDYINAFRYNVGRKEVVEDLTRVLKVKDAALYDKMRPTGFNPDGYVNAASIAEAQDWFAGHGMVKEKIDVNKQLIDNSFCDYAVEIIGPYKPPKK